MEKMDKTTANTTREKEIYKVTIVGSIVNFVLVVFKFLAGILGGSAAMIADAVHSLTDFVTDIIVIAFVRISAQPSDRSHDFGHGKYETLATAIIGLLLLFVGIGIFWNGVTAIHYVWQGNTLKSPGMVALVAAVVSVVSKELIYQYTMRSARKLNSPVVAANAWHHRSDAFSSIGTGIGICGAIFIGDDWSVLDPIAAALVSIFIIKEAIVMLKPCVDELLEKSLPAEEEQVIEDIILSCTGVSSPHNLRTRRLGSYIAMEVHVLMDGNVTLNEAHKASSEIERKLREHFGPRTMVNVHMEPTKE